jgi:pimeloyl-ACP methyl ester carboxylesterase
MMLLLALLALVSSGQAQFAFFNQSLDHENPVAGHFAQRYYWNSSLADGPASPVLLMVGGEMRLEEWIEILGGAVFPLAEASHAHILALEHRGFGESPLEPGSIKNLTLLTVEQAVKDLGSFQRVAFQSMGLDPSAPWVGFGCSYSGAVASFAAQAGSGGPVLAGTVASSAAILATTSYEAYNAEMFEAFGDVSAGGSAQCQSILLEAVSQSAELVVGDASDWSSLASTWGACEGSIPQTLKDAQFMWYMMFELFMGSQVVQESRHQFIPFACSSWTTSVQQGLTPLQALGYWSKLTRRGQCWDTGVLADYEAELMNTSSDPSQWDRQYEYLLCSVMGWWHSCEDSACFSNHTVPVLPTSWFHDICELVFSISPEQQAATATALNAKFGGRAPPPTSNVLYVLGGADPWRGVGVDPSMPRSPSPITVEGGWHCSDMGWPSPYDPAPVVQAKTAIKAQVMSWLSG